MKLRSKTKGYGAMPESIQRWKTRPLGGSGTEVLMKRAVMGVSAAAAIALAPLCIPPAQAHADDRCVSTNPAAHQACIDGFLRDDPLRRYQGNCEASPLYGQEGQFCRDFWVRKSAPPNAGRGYAERIKTAPAPASRQLWTGTTSGT
jgi:hypothetical protein